MKNNLLMTLGLVVAGFSIQAQAAKKTTETQLQVDPAATTVNWHASKVTGAHDGVIGVKSGTLQLNGKDLVGGEIVVDMPSLKSTDLKDEKSAGKLEGHLKSDDFFKVEKFPTSTLKITKVTPIAGTKAGEPTHTITGDLTMLDKTNSVTFPATLITTDKGLTGTADLKLDRTKWGLVYGSSSFIKGLGDKAIDNEFSLKVNLAAKK